MPRHPSPDVVVIGAGPAGVLAAIRAADLGARTTLVSSGDFGGMAANDGPVPVRTLAYAARLMHEARHLPRYGITASIPELRYDRLLARVREVVEDVRSRSALRERIDALGVTVYEKAGAARFTGPHTILTDGGLRLEAEKFIICTGGVSRRLAIPGFEHTSTHSDALRLSAVPPSILVVGAGSSGVQVASMFHAFGSRVQLFEAGPRILPAEDETVAATVAGELRSMGVGVHQRFGAITSFERTPAGVRMNYRTDDRDGSAEAAVVVVATGWVADTAGLHLAEAGVELDPRGNIRVDQFLRTSAPHIFAAGDVTGRLMLVPGAVEDGFVAATNAVQGPTLPLPHRVCPSGSFTHPEYAQVGLTEAKARESHDVVTAVMPFESAVRAIIEGRTFGFCKLVVERTSCRILGCHVVGERAVEIVQVAAIAMTARMRVDDLVRAAISFPTYAEVLFYTAVRAAVELGLPLSGQAEHMAL
jgi:pyruvate/2-oxoglutarate dehydrogenase complex dihydrolipoamide dehydrogenase (E3) component